MILQGKRILVTGGAGFIGSHIVDSLVKQSAHVIVYDDFRKGDLKNLENSIKDIEIVKGDILDQSSLNKACKNIDIISHQAAQLEITRSRDDPAADLTTNTIGTLNVLRAAQEKQIPKIINASSACVYGQAEIIPQTENHNLNPNWQYGVSKLAAEKYCKIFNADFNTNIINLRYSIVYGEREWFGRVLTIFLKRAQLGKAPVIFGNGNQLRDYIYVKDLVEAHNLCLMSDLVYDTFNVSTGVGTSISNLARLVIDLFLDNIKPIYEDVKEGEMSQFVNGRIRLPSELKQMVLDSTYITKTLGWKPKTSLERGLKLEMDWLKENPEQWKDETFQFV